MIDALSSHFGFGGLTGLLFASTLSLLAIVALAALLIVAAVYITRQSGRKSVTPRAPNIIDLLFYFLLIWILGPFGAVIVVLTWSKFHVKNGDWWGWWNKQDK